MRISTGKHTYVSSVEYEIGRDVMRVLVFLHVRELTAQISDITMLVCHLVHSHIGYHRELLVAILHHVEVTVQQSAHARRIRNYGSELVQIKFIKADSDVL